MLRLLTHLFGRRRTLRKHHVSDRGRRGRQQEFRPRSLGLSLDQKSPSDGVEAGPFNSHGVWVKFASTLNPMKEMQLSDGERSGLMTVSPKVVKTGLKGKVRENTLRSDEIRLFRNLL